MNAKHIFAFGPPAATKGYTLKFLEPLLPKRFSRFVISDLIRREFEYDEEFKALALSLQAKRELLPCAAVDRLVRKYVPRDISEIIGVDGGPRTEEQVGLFDAYFRIQTTPVEMFLFDFGNAPDAFYDALFLHTQHAEDRKDRVDGDKLETHQKGVAIYRENRDPVLSAAQKHGWNVVQINPALTTAAKVLKIAQSAKLSIPIAQILRFSKQTETRPLPPSVLRFAA